MEDEKIRELAFKYAVLNAIKYNGKANLNAVVSKLFREDPSIRPHAREVVALVKEVIKEVNKKSLEELKEIAKEKWPEKLKEKPAEEEKKTLPPLPNVNKYIQVVTRFAPNPDFILHLGSARPAILSYKYAKMYKGKFILRFEDTDPKTKTPILDAYGAIKDDLTWLGLEWDEEHIQSKRMEIYYAHARKLIELGGAYICTCSINKIRKYRRLGIACEHSKESVNLQLEKWDRMLEGYYGEGEAVLRVKTDIKYPDPSVRDWVAFRIIDTAKHPHPLVGDRYVVWPTYNFACGVDDHLMGVTHVLRAKEHITNTIKQKFMYRHFNWDYPEAIHFGRLNLEDMILSKSKIRKGIEEGKYLSWDDPRLGTLKALRKRGFLPEAIWDIIIDVGIKPSGATISIANLYAINRKYLEPKANRYMFVPDPVKLKLKNLPPDIEAKIPYHPSFPERGYRIIRPKINSGISIVFISRNDLDRLKDKSFRLLGFANFKLLANDVVHAEFINKDSKYAKEHKLPIIQWVPDKPHVNVEIIKPEREKISFIRGVAEEEVGKLNPDDRVQFFRFGFVRIDNVSESTIKAYFTHD